MNWDDLMELHFLNIWDEEEVTKKIEIPVTKTGCWHQWVDYTGLNEVVKVCKHCEIRQDDPLLRD